MTKRLCYLVFLVTTAAIVHGAGGFLFVTFNSEATPMTEQIYFGLSRDGRDWKALNKAEPVLISKLGEKGIRDPFIFRSHDGKKTYIIATDLSINLNPDWGRAVREASKSIVIWETTDLVHWSEPRLVKVSPDDAGCTWAPEAIYDENTHDYLVFWASKNGRDNFAKFRIWATHTKDFVTFGEPFIYIEKPQDIIDTDIVRENGKYYRFSKDEAFKAITMEASDKLAGPWHDVPGFTLAKAVGYEGPACYLLERSDTGKSGTWCLLLDNYARHRGYQPYVTHDLASGKFEPAADIKFPFPFRHGAVLPVSEAEYDRLVAAYGTR